jgi:hypothetical protein
MSVYEPVVDEIREKDVSETPDGTVEITEALKEILLDGVGETMNEVSNEVFEGGRMAVDEGTDSGFSGWEWAFVEVRNDTLLIDA